MGAGRRDTLIDGCEARRSRRRAVPVWFGSRITFLREELRMRTAEHDSWTEAYNNPELYKWLLEHKRAGAETK